MGKRNKSLGTGSLRAWCVVLLAGAIAVLVSACGGTSSSGSSTSGASSTDGTLNISIATVTQENPALSGYQNIGEWLAYEPLIRANATNTYTPDLATKFGYVGSGNREFQMTIRKGVEFADGTPMTAADVVNSINYMLKHPGGVAENVASITSVTSSGEVVTVKLKAGNPSLPYVFSQVDNYGDVISPAGLANPSKLNSESFGAGAYTLDLPQTVSGDHYTYVKNPHFWDPAEQHYATIVVKVIPDPSTAYEALQSGQTNVAYENIDGNLVHQAKSAGGEEVVSGDQSTLFADILDTQGKLVPALKSAEVRQALRL
jgi:peptide/nickel transport system substrate-binding protein